MARHSILLIKSRDLGWSECSATLREMTDVHVVGEPSCPVRGRDLACALRPDFILSAAHVDGVSMAPALVELQKGPCPSTAIVLLSSSIGPADVDATRDLQLGGWLLWNELTADGLRHALSAVLLGEFLVGSRPIVDALLADRHPQAATIQVAPTLTGRECAVLRHLADGATRQMVAASEGLSPRTVDRIVAGLEAKLEAPTQACLIAKAYRLGLLL